MEKRRAGKIPDYLRSEISLRVSPWDWLTKARQLHRDANLLFAKFKVEQEEYDKALSYEAPIPDVSTVEMLIGFAVENLLKGLYVVNAKISVENVKELKTLRIPGSRHDLIPIAEALKDPPLSLGFSKDEQDILSALEHVVLWFGRYPSARDLDDLIPMDASGLFRKFSFTYPDDHFAALRLYDRLEAVLAGRAPKPRPKGGLFGEF